MLVETSAQSYKGRSPSICFFYTKSKTNNNVWKLCIDEKTLKLFNLCIIIFLIVVHSHKY